MSNSTKGHGSDRDDLPSFDKLYPNPGVKRERMPDDRHWIDKIACFLRGGHNFRVMLTNPRDPNSEPALTDDGQVKRICWGCDLREWEGNAGFEFHMTVVRCLVVAMIIVGYALQIADARSTQAWYALCKGQDLTLIQALSIRSRASSEVSENATRCP